MATRILVTGSSGLIGKRIIEQNSRLEFVELPREIDLLKIYNLDQVVSIAKTNKVSAILHLAWVSNRVANYSELQINWDWANSSISLADLCFNNNLKFYGLGTCLDSIDLSNPYIDSKKYFKAHTINQVKGGAGAIFRPFYVIDEIFLRPRIYNEIVSSPNFILKKPSELNDFVHSVDVATGIIRSIEEEATGEIDLGSGTLRSNFELASKICASLGKSTPRFAVDSPSKGPRAQIEPLLKMGWKPFSTKRFFNEE